MASPAHIGLAVRHIFIFYNDIIATNSQFKL